RLPVCTRRRQAGTDPRDRRSPRAQAGQRIGGAFGTVHTGRSCETRRATRQRRRRVGRCSVGRFPARRTRIGRGPLRRLRRQRHACGIEQPVCAVGRVGSASCADETNRACRVVGVRQKRLTATYDSNAGSFFFTAAFFSATYSGNPSLPYGGVASPRISGDRYLRAAAVIP